MSDKKLLTAAEIKKKQAEAEKDKKKQRVLKPSFGGGAGRDVINKVVKKVIDEKGPPSVITKDARINRIQKELSKVMNAERMAKGGRVGLKSGSKVCKLAKRGKGRAYGKNS